MFDKERKRIRNVPLLYCEIHGYVVVLVIVLWFLVVKQPENKLYHEISQKYT
jgi:predicted nucleic acid-binding Zn ribbon protein